MMHRSSRLCHGLTGLLALSFAACAPVGRVQAAGPPSLKLAVTGLTPAIHQGATLTIRWRARNAPRDAKVSLWVLKILTGHLIGPIASDLPLSGSYAWRIPSARPRIRCQMDRTRSCTGSIASGMRYAIVARMDMIASGSPPGIARKLAPKRLVASAESAAFLLIATNHAPGK